MAKLKYDNDGNLIDVELGMSPERNPRFRNDRRPIDNSEGLKKRTSEDYRDGPWRCLKGQEFERAKEEFLRNWSRKGY